MTKPLMRDFIYLDVERVRSFVAQASGGLTSERSSQSQHQTGGEGKVEGGIPVIGKASGSTDYHYLRSQSETKSLHDHIFAEFYQHLKPGEQLKDFTNIKEAEWIESSFSDSDFIVTQGILKIVDYQSIIATMQNLPTLIDLVGKVTTYAAGTNTQLNTPLTSKTSGKPKGGANVQSTEVQLAKNQLRTLPIKEMSGFITQMYGDAIKVKIFPFQHSQEKLFVDMADRILFRYSPTALVNLYGSVIDAGWVTLLQINKGTYHEPGQMLSKTGNDMEDSLEQLADIFSGLAKLTQGIKFPAVAVTPIAIFRDI
jgi:hypothetical protein